MTGQLTDILVELGYQGEDYSANYHCAFFFSISFNTDFLEALYWRSGLNVLIAFEMAMPVKKL